MANPGGAPDGTLQELRGKESRMVGILTHVEEVAAAMPMRIEVRKGSRSSVIAVTGEKKEGVLARGCSCTYENVN